jgi:hypothetical protein
MPRAFRSSSRKEKNMAKTILSFRANDEENRMDIYVNNVKVSHCEINFLDRIMEDWQLMSQKEKDLYNNDMLQFIYDMQMDRLACGLD